MFLNGMLEVKPFDCRENGFMGHFPPFNLHIYILLCVDYVAKCIEVIACTVNDAHLVTNFLKNNVFARFRVHKVLTSDGGTYFLTSIWKVCLRSIM